MNRAVLAAGAVVLVSNGAALFQAARNRWGPPEASVEITERDLRLNWAREGNSHRFVTLHWTNPNPEWLDETKLATLGFDLSERASNRRRGVRFAYVAFEIDGPAWQKMAGPKPWQDAPRIVTIDVDHDPVRLRSRNPDRSKVLILPATVGAYWNGQRLRGSVFALLSRDISLPPGMVNGLDPAWPAGAPRFAMRIAVGPNYEPYVAGFRRLAP